MAENYKLLYEQTKKMLAMYQDEIVPGFRKTIEELEAKSKWIPVTERLPKREDANLYESILAINKEDGVPRSWIWDIVVDYRTEFTHWMPLPEPPKGEI